MRRAAAWNVRGVERETQEVAAEAARRAGMSLADWLDQVVAEQAAELGVSGQDWDEDRKLDEIGDRLSRLSRREERQGFARRPRPPEPRVEREIERPRDIEARRAQSRVDEAIARLEARTVRAEQRTTKALESVAGWIESREADRSAERDALASVAESLDALERRSARIEEIATAPRVARPAKPEPDDDLDIRLDELSRRVNARRSAPPAARARPRIDVRDSVSRIAMRQSQLDAREPLRAPRAAPPPEPAAETQRRPFGIDAPANEPVAPEPVRPAQVEAKTHTLREEIQGLRARLDRLRTQQTVEPAASAKELRAGLASMSRSLADIAPRNGSLALESAVGDLNQRLESARDAGAHPLALAPIERMLREVLDALREYDPQAAVGKLERELRSLSSKMENLAAASLAPGALEHIRQQTEEVRNLLASAASRSLPVERLERQIGNLGDRIERLAHSPTPQFDVETALQSLAEARKQIEGSTAPAQLASIERRLEGLSQRIDQALQRPAGPSIDPRPLEELARRIESIRASVERQADNQPDLGNLETALREINRKLDSTAQQDPKVFSAALQGLASKIEDASRRSAPAAALDLRPIEELARRIEGVRATVERQPDLTAHTAKLEAALADISAKLDRPAAPGDSRALNATLQSLTARLEDAFRKPQAVPLDTRPLDDLASRIDSVRAVVERQSVAQPDLGRLEESLREISGKLDRADSAPETSTALVEAIHDLAERMERPSAATVDMAPIEAMMRRLGDKIDRAAAPQAGSFDLAPIADVLNRLDAKLQSASAGGSLDMRSLESTLRRLDDKLDAVAEHATRPIELAIEALGEKIDMRLEPQIDAKLVEQAADILAKRLERRAGPIDADALVNQISEIHGRIDALGSSANSNAALERTVSDLIDELEATRKTLAARSSEGAGGVSREVAELRTEQAASDRRMGARLSSLQGILEQLVNKLGQMEELDDAPSAVPVPAPPRPASQRTPEADMRAIPDRAIPARPASKPAPSVQTPSHGDMQGFLLEPGAARASRGSEPEAASVPQGAGINVHIAAARRAAQAAMAERARGAAGADTGGAKASSAAGLAGRVQQQAQALLAGRRRPLLLAAAVLAIAALAAFQFRGGHSAPVQKSELPATRANPTPLASATPKVDFAPTGAIDKPAEAPSAEAPIAEAPKLAAPAAARTPSADLLIAMPAGLPTALHDLALAGDAAAETEMGLRFLEGRGVTRDPKMALRWLESAAAQGAPVAQYRTATLYEKGIGAPRDAASARSWYLKAANSGNARAMHNLAVLYAEDGGTGKPDYASASAWFRRAGELGVRDSQFNLGVLYGRGLGVPQDMVQSWLWFGLAAQQGDADAARKRDEVAGRLNPKDLAAAQKALAEFKTLVPLPAANEAPTPPGGWDKANPPQAARPPAGPATQGALAVPAKRI